MANQFRVISRSRLNFVLGEAAADQLLEISSREARTSLLAKKVDSLLEPWGGMMPTDFFIKCIRRMQTSLFGLDPADLDRFLENGDPTVAWIGSDDMLVAGLTLAYWDSSGDHDDGLRAVRKLVRWCKDLRVNIETMWFNLERFFPSEIVERVRLETGHRKLVADIWQPIAAEVSVGREQTSATLASAGLFMDCFETSPICISSQIVQ